MVAIGSCEPQHDLIFLMSLLLRLSTIATTDNLGSGNLQFSSLVQQFATLTTCQKKSTMLTMQPCQMPKAGIARPPAHGFAHRSKVLRQSGCRQCGLVDDPLDNPKKLHTNTQKTRATSSCSHEFLCTIYTRPSYLKHHLGFS